MRRKRKTGYGVKIAYYSRDFHLEAAATAVRKRERALHCLARDVPAGWQMQGEQDYHVGVP